MKFAIVVHAAPYSSEGCLSALKFTQAAIAAGHEVLRVFFYHDGVYAANKLIAPPQDEIDIVSGWQAINEQHGVELKTVVERSLQKAKRDRQRRRKLREVFGLKSIV